MKATGRRGWPSTLVQMTLLLLLLPLLSPTQAGYNKKLCRKYAKGTTEKLPSPYVWDDFSVLTETAVHVGENGTRNTLSRETTKFSNTYRQVMISQESRSSQFMFHVDEPLGDCIIKRDDYECQESYRLCLSASYAVGFMKVGPQQLDIGTPSGSLRWPTTEVDVKAEVNMGEGVSRDIHCKKYATCTYDSTNDLTTVSEWRILDTEKYPRLDQTKPLVVSAYHHSESRNSGIVLEQRIDYMDFKKLSPFEMKHGLEVQEGQCGVVQSKFMSKTIPKPPKRFFFAVEMGISDESKVNSYETEVGSKEFNYNSQLEMSRYLRAVNKETFEEEESTVIIHDFSTSHLYRHSLSRGDCTVFDLARAHGESMQTPEDFWHLNAPRSAYLGVFVDRDIPCDVWRLDYSKEGDDETQEDSATLYLATAEWLRVQGKPVDEFYPVQMIRRFAGMSFFYSYFEFATNPGYHIPDLPTCFEQDDTINGMVTLETNYYQTIAPSEVYFTYEFRNLLKKVTGIKSSIRIGGITAIPSPDFPDETLVAFSIYGLFKNVNSSRTSFYETDPVTNRQAEAKINAMVDQGTVQFRLGTQSVSMTFKKGSFGEVSNNGRLHLRYMDRPSQGESAGYSSGAMAGVGIAVLLVGMLLAIGAVFFYKRWTEGGGTGLSFGMESFSADA